MAKEQKLDRFDRFVPVEPWVNPWQPDGSYTPDVALLQQLLSVAVGSTQQSGVVAAATDVWAAEELRRAGFDADEVWPRRRQPRVFPRDLRNFIESGALTKDLRAKVEARLTNAKSRKALPAEANVLGGAYTKQADVVVASWAAGVEILVSTKTMLSSYRKNLRNRFEEGYGDAKNIRGRHPLAALGFLYVVGADIDDGSFEFAVDMLRKLVREPDVYDCACLLVLEGAQGVTDAPEDEEERGGDDEPAALVPLPAADGSDEDEEAPGPAATEEEAASSAVRLISENVPNDLSPEVFFRTLIADALERMPVAVYPEVRRRIELARSDAR